MSCNLRDPNNIPKREGMVPGNKTIKLYLISNTHLQYKSEILHDIIINCFIVTGIIYAYMHILQCV